MNLGQFGMPAMGTLAVCSSKSVLRDSGGISEECVSITTPDGIMDASFVRPLSGRHPAILTRPDNMGVRDAIQLFGSRLARQGYGVLVIKSHYRSARALQFNRGDAYFVAQGGYENVQSPHKLIAGTRAGYLFAIGQNDDLESPEDKNVLWQAAVAARRPAEVEVYPAVHGWMLPDSTVYDPVQAGRAWPRMSALFGKL